MGPPLLDTGGTAAVRRFVAEEKKEVIEEYRAFLRPAALEPGFKICGSQLALGIFRESACPTGTTRLLLEVGNNGLEW